MERETELTQSWSPEVSENWGGLLKGNIPVVAGGEMRTFSLPVPQDDDGTDISLKDWQLGPSSQRDHTSNTSTVSSSIKPFKGSVRTRFTPVEPRLDEVQSSPDHFETPVTTPRISGSTSRSSSVSGDHSDTNAGFDTTSSTATTTITTQAPVAFDIPAKDEGTTPPPPPAASAADQSTSTLRAHSLRVSFKDSTTKAPNHRHSAPPIVRHRSPLRSRSILPSKSEVKSLQPKWESSTKIRPERVSSVGSLMKSGSTPRQAQARSKVKRARVAGATPTRQQVPSSSEIEAEAPGGGDLQGSSGYLSEGGRYLSEYSGRDQSLGRDEFASQRLSRELTMSPIRKVDPFFDHGGSRPAAHSLNRSFGGYRNGIVDNLDSDDDDEERMKGGMLCGGGITDTKLSGDFVRLLSKLCRVSVPATPSPKVMSKSASARGGRNNAIGRSNNPTSLSWDPSSVGDNNSSSNSNNNNKIAILGRHDSLKLLSERCSNAPTPSYPSHKPRKIRDHEPHIHFYKTISKALDQKLKS